MNVGTCGVIAFAWPEHLNRVADGLRRMFLLRSLSMWAGGIRQWAKFIVCLPSYKYPTTISVLLSYLPQAPSLSAQATTHCSHGYTTSSASPNRVVTRSATMLAVFGIALSSFSLKQLLAKKQKHQGLRKL